MCKHASIQTWLLTLTGCSWTLLFLTVQRQGSNTFKSHSNSQKYIDEYQAISSPTKPLLDSCSFCWQTQFNLDPKEKPSHSEFWSYFTQSSSNYEIDNNLEKRNGIGSYYYYTLNTALTTIKLKLKYARTVAGEAKYEIMKLEQKIDQLQSILHNYFNPDENPYDQNNNIPDAVLNMNSGTSKSQQNDENINDKRASSEYTFGSNILRIKSSEPVQLRNPSALFLNQKITNKSTLKHKPNLDFLSPLTVLKGKAIKALQPNKYQYDSKSDGFTTNLNVIKNVKLNYSFHRRLLSSNEFTTKDITQLVSVIVNTKYSYSALGTLLNSLSKLYPGISVHISQFKNQKDFIYNNIRLRYHSMSQNSSDGYINNNLIKYVTTPYVLVANNLNKVTERSNILKLVKYLEKYGLWAISGTLISVNRQYRHGCMISKYKNYESIWKRGSLGSLDDLLFCDTLEGTFLSVTLVLQNLRWNELLPSTAAHIELFLRAYHYHHYTSGVCLDSMMFDARPLPGINTVVKTDLTELGRLHYLHYLSLPGGLNAKLSCDELLERGCGRKGEIVPPCCIEQLENLITFFMSTCEQYGIICELQEGTLLGAVKLSQILPWERDADVTFHTGNFTALQSLAPVFTDAGYTLKLTDNRWCCVDGRQAGGEGTVSSSHWTLELYSQHRMDTEDLRNQNMKGTRIKLGKSWLLAPSSPGLYVRNRYGHDIYRHAEHWLDTGRESGWDIYDTRRFQRCTREGYHACLDQYSTDGILQFLQ